MLNIQVIIALWVLLSIPLGFFVAAFLDVSRGPENPDDERIS